MSGDRPRHPGAAGGGDDDDSLAAERTSLAWGRTGLALLACGAAVLKGIPDVTGRGERPGAGTAIVVTAAALWLQSLWNERRRRAAIARGEVVAGAGSMRSVAATTGVIGSVAFLVALTM